MVMSQAKRLKNWDKKSCTSSRLSDERDHLNREDVEWIAMHALTFAKYYSSLIETKQNGWKTIPKRQISHASEHIEQSSALQNKQSPAEIEFEKQREAFNKIPASELAPYQGQFVAVRNGVIVDSDYDPMELSRRFYERYGGMPVYKTRIGGRRVVNIPAPFLR